MMREPQTVEQVTDYELALRVYNALVPLANEGDVYAQRWMPRLLKPSWYQSLRLLRFDVSQAIDQAIRGAFAETTEAAAARWRYHTPPASHRACCAPIGWRYSFSQHFMEFVCSHCVQVLDGISRSAFNQLTLDEQGRIANLPRLDDIADWWRIWLQYPERRTEDAQRLLLAFYELVIEANIPEGIEIPDELFARFALSVEQAKVAGAEL